MKLNDLHILMDDLVRTPGLSDSDLAARETELHAALDAHPEWMSEMRTRDAFDVRLCEVMPQVDVPTGLKERLLAAVDETQTSAKLTSTPDRERRSRHRALGMVTTAALMFAAALWLALNPLPPSLTVADVENQLPELWDTLDSTSVATVPTEAALPSTGWDSHRLRFPHAWNTHLLTDASNQPLAFRKLEFFDNRGRSHTGLLASLPLTSFSTPNQPRATIDPFSLKPKYLPASDGSMLAIVTWTDTQTERVYFLVVPAEDHTLKALEELLYVPAV